LRPLRLGVRSKSGLCGLCAFACDRNPAFASLRAIEIRPLRPLRLGVRSRSGLCGLCALACDRNPAFAAFAPWRAIEIRPLRPLRLGVRSRSGLCGLCALACDRDPAFAAFASWRAIEIRPLRPLRLCVRSRSGLCGLCALACDRNREVLKMDTRRQLALAGPCAILASDGLQHPTRNLPPMTGPTIHRGTANSPAAQASSGSDRIGEAISRPVLRKSSFPLFPALH
jgi:ferredoxin